jgi:hypothetical protein
VSADPSNNTLLTIISSVVAALLGGGGVGIFVKAVAGRRTVRADAAAKLSDNALRWVKEFQDDAKTARAEAAACRREMSEVRLEAEQLRDELIRTLRIVRRVRDAIADPNVSRERLTQLIEMIDPERSQQ